MKKLTLAVALIGITFAASSQAIGYLKIEDIAGEVQAQSQAPASTENGESEAEPIQGGLDRDIIRRNSDRAKDNKIKPKVEPKSTATPATRLPTSNTRLQGVEPDEID